MVRYRRSVLALLAGLLLLAGCATLREVAALRTVAFAIDRVSDVRIAGIAIDRVNGYSDLGTLDVARLAASVAAKQVPLDLVIHVQAENPKDNDVTARLVGLDWKLFISDRETVTGRHTGTFLLPPGQPVDVPVSASLELTRFFGGGGRELFDLALALAGRGNTPASVRLEAMPTIETPLGPMRFPTPIRIERRAP
jgi:hypothetical protein